jgi:hypothetical protein
MGVAFPPFDSPKRQPDDLMRADDRVSWRIVSVVEYRGSEGIVLVSTVQPSPAALRPGLNLGSPLGTLPDGTETFTMISGDFRHQIRWFRDGHIVAITSDLPLERLEALAADVVLR